METNSREQIARSHKLVGIIEIPILLAGSNPILSLLLKTEQNE
jgi:hypothetical protein